MSTTYQVGSSWLGFSKLGYLIILCVNKPLELAFTKISQADYFCCSGDSYSAVGFDHRDHPSASQPLGVPFPGDTYNEPDLPNWVGYLITKYCPPPRFDPSKEEQDSHYKESPLLVYDYAEGGATIANVCSQIKSFKSFSPLLVSNRAEGGATISNARSQIKSFFKSSSVMEVKERLDQWKATDTLFSEFFLWIFDDSPQ